MRSFIFQPVSKILKLIRGASHPKIALALAKGRKSPAGATGLNVVKVNGGKASHGMEFFNVVKRIVMAAHGSTTTTDLKEIRQWAEKRGGKPVRVKGTENGNGAGVLRIDFPGYSGGDSLEEINWEEWYKTFKDRGLAFLYQDKTSDGKESRFFKLIKEGEDK